MEQFDQLLTCCVCLDRYRNPKLLPCQHSFCMEPCMEGLVDYVRRQVKCPECRAEHRIPYQGVQAFPTNVTLQRFLELHIDLTGELPDPTSNQIMERCQICSEKAYLNSCAHCEKKVCPDCKEAHVEVVKREIARLSSQVRRVLHRLEDALNVTEKSLAGLKGNQSHVLDEVDDLVRRFIKAINDKADTIRHEIENYVSTELTTLNSYKTNLETEISNIQSNCDLVDKHMVVEGGGGGEISWDDQELMDTKDIFLKTLEFIRNFDYEPGDRRIRFIAGHDSNQLVQALTNFGDLILPNAIFAPQISKPAPVQPPPVQPSPGIMRSKSDHRLVQQYRDLDMDMDEKPTSFRSKYSKYGASAGDGDSKLRRFTRKLMDDDDEDGRLGGFNDGEDRPKPACNRIRVIETDEAVKGPLSGVSRLLDSTRVLEKMVEYEHPRKKTAPSSGPGAVPLAIQQMQQHMQKLLQQKQQQQQNQTPTTPTSPTTAPWRQQSVDKSKTAAASSTPQQPSLMRQQSKVEKPRSESESSSSDHHSGSSSASSTSSSRKVSTGASFTTEEIKRKFSTTPAVPQTSTSSAKSSGPATSTVNKYRRNLTPVASATKVNKDDDDDDESETSSEESEESESDEPVAAPKKNLSKMEKTDIGPLLARSAIARDREQPATSHRRESTLRDYDSYRPRDYETPTARRQERERERERERDLHDSSSSSSRQRDTEPVSSTRSRYTDSTTTDQSRRNRDPPPLERRVSRDEGSQPGAMYSAYRARQPKSPPERHYGSSSGTSGSGAGSSAASRYGTPSSTTSSPYDYGLSRSRTGTSLYEPPESSASRLQAKYLNRSRHNLGGSVDVPDDHIRPSGNPYYTGRSSYLAKPWSERRDSNASMTASDWTRESPREKSKLLLSKSKSHHELAQPAVQNEDENLSSWARYLKNKYGKTVTPIPGNNSSQSSSTHTADSLYDGSGGRNLRGKSVSPQSHAVTTAQYSGKKRLIFKFGSRGSDPGQFTWPRGIACSSDGTIAVADSSNHRIQIFDPSGQFLKEFGSYGNSDGEFDCQAGVAINRINQFIVSDRYNHRIQVFDPSCKFLRSFGTQGSGDGKFNHPWGIATDVLGFIYVCDKDNHRIQVFQSDGTFVGKFGSGELDNPHYVAVTNTNKVVVSDTGHHRICIFDVNGKMLATFGTEGIEHGQFKLPRGVAVDEQGYIFVADSGNNRIQIFNPDGVHIKSFGSWGSGDREFKGLEGIAVNSEGNVLVCDRENHRVQVF